MGRKDGEGEGEKGRGKIRRKGRRERKRGGRDGKGGTEREMGRRKEKTKTGEQLIKGKRKKITQRKRRGRGPPVSRRRPHRPHTQALLIVGTCSVVTLLPIVVSRCYF